jgi:hypothetical protein
MGMTEHADIPEIESTSDEALKTRLWAVGQKP